MRSDNSKLLERTTVYHRGITAHARDVATNDENHESPWYMTEREKFLVISTTAVLILLNISPINEAVGTILLGYICLFSLSNPLSALIALSASQVVADPIGIPLTLAQSLFLAWPLHILFNRDTVNYRPLRILTLWTLPTIMFLKLLSVAKWGVFETFSPFDLAVVIGSMGAWYIGKLQGRWLLGLTCLGLGTIPSVITFWLYMLGVPTEGIVAAKAAGIQAGVGVGRSDGNLAGVSIAIASVILFAVAASVQSLRETGSQNRGSAVIQAFILVISIPAVLGTMSRGGVVYFALGIGTVFILMQKSFSNVFKFCIAVGILMLFLQRAGVYQIAQRYLDSMISHSAEQMEQSILMSHEGVLRGSIAEVLSSPLIGTTPSIRVAIPGYGYRYASHNVWLDFGRGAGIPGMIWFTFFFAFPIYRLTHTWGIRPAMPFIATFVVFFSVFMILSLGNYKTFYVLWVLTYAASCTKFEPLSNVVQF